jgi:hypothetical protein
MCRGLNGPFQWEVAGIVLAVTYNYSEVEEFYGNIFQIMF